MRTTPTMMAGRFMPVSVIRYLLSAIHPTSAAAKTPLPGIRHAWTTDNASFPLDEMTHGGMVARS
jgi:hypothetical protein